MLGEEAILSGEAHCRSRLDLPGDQLRLLDAVADAAEKLIVVILAGRPLELADVAERADAMLFVFIQGLVLVPRWLTCSLGMPIPAVGAGHAAKERRAGSYLLRKREYRSTAAQGRSAVS